MEKSLKINSHLRVSNAGEETLAISRKLEDRKRRWWFEEKEKMEKSPEINLHLRFEPTQTNTETILRKKDRKRG